MGTDPSTLALSEIANALRSGNLSDAELTEHCIGRRNYALHAYKSWRPEVAMDMATLADQAFADQRDLGALQGIPISLKDLYAVREMEIYAGSSRLLPDAFQREGPLVEKLRQQRAVFTGKTHTVEFAFDGLGVNSHWGTPRNLWDTAVHRVPGGSSSGAGVSLIEGSAILAFGSDTAGSVRIPASLTGTVGLKTTHGRWPLAGICPLSPTLDTSGLLARTATDMLFAFAAIDPTTSVRKSPAFDNSSASTSRSALLLSPWCWPWPSSRKALTSHRTQREKATALPPLLLFGQLSHYNAERPHSSLGYRPPAPETIVMPSWPPGSATLRRPPSLGEEPSMR